ncbi:MAG: tRNA (adenosine(37)-N6)-dimethylallyltransferase MiaA [Pseudomonadota bacterium]
MPFSKKVIIISGPTACGKTLWGIELGQYLQTSFNTPAQIINFDSLLFYRELNIGTAKPTNAERGLIPHHLIDVASISHPMNAAAFFQRASALLNDFLQQDQVVILVGGSGFYLRALLKGMYSGETTPDNVKKDLEGLYQREGIAPLLQMLRDLDPASFQELHMNDHYRITRALEYVLTHQRPISEDKKILAEQRPYDFSQTIYPHIRFFHIYLDLPKEEHRLRVIERSRKMIEQGLIEEVQGLLSAGFTGKEKPLQSIGYSQVLSYLSGEIKNINECLEKINLATRQLAKAQRTFFKKITPKNSYHPFGQRDQILGDLDFFLKEVSF